MEAKTAECDVPHDAPGHDHPDADPKAHLHVDASAAQRARRQQNEELMVAGLRASGRRCSECHDRALARAKQ
jgi:hypothetical protein